MSDDRLDGMGDLAGAALARRSLVAFSSRMDERYERAGHLDYLCSHLEALERREFDRLLVCCPPRHGKSRALTDFLSWYVGRRSREHAVFASYAAELAESKSRSARGLLEHERYPFATRVDPASAATDRWGTTSGGLVRAIGSGGGLTGWGADCLIVDDAVRDAEAALSVTAMDGLWEWFSSTARTRLEARGVICVAGTRWSDQDLISRILASPGASRWVKVILPAIAEDGDPLGRAPGEALWPARFPVSELPSVEQGELSSRQFAALYQQRPTPAEGSLFRAAWFPRYTSLPLEAPTQTQEDIMRRYAGYEDFAAPARGPRMTKFLAVDTASKTGVGNDFSALVTLAYDYDRKLVYVVNVERGRWEFADLARHVCATFFRERPAKVYVEDSSAGVAIVQELKRLTALPIVGVPPKGSKIARAEATTAVCEAGRVLLPQAAEWLSPFLDELASFPYGRHDDMVDALVLGLTSLRVAIAATRDRQQLVSQAEAALLNPR